MFVTTIATAAAAAYDYSHTEHVADVSDGVLTDLDGNIHEIPTRREVRIVQVRTRDDLGADSHRYLANYQADRYRSGGHWTVTLGTRERA